MITTKTISKTRIGVAGGFRAIDISPNPATPSGYKTKATIAETLYPIGTDFKYMTMDSDWKVKVSRKQDATNPYEATSYKVGKVASHTVYSSGFSPSGPYTQSSWIYASRRYPFSAVTKLRPEIDDMTVKQFKSKLNRNEIGKFNALVPIAEFKDLHSSCVGLVNSATRVARQVLGKSYAKKLSPMSFLSFTADAWLQWSFGISPILSDIKKANAAISAFITRQDKTISIDAIGKTEWVGRESDDPWNMYYGMDHILITRGYHLYETRLAGGYDVKLTNSFDYTASEWFGVSWQGVAEVLYELTPYSWLLDYFTTIGDVISDDPVVTETPTWLYRTTQVTSRYMSDFECRQWNNQGPFRVRIDKEIKTQGSAEAHYIKRTKLATLPPLTLRLKTFQEMERFGESKLANILSVLRMRSETNRVRLSHDEARALRRRYMR